MKKILFIILLFVLLSFHPYCQVTREGIKNAIDKAQGYKESDKQNFGNYLYSRRNNNCISESVYVIKYAIQANVVVTAYYCVDELSQCNNDYKQLIKYYGSNGLRQDKIRNPNYKKAYSGDNNGRATNNNQIQGTNYVTPPINLPDAYSLSRLDETGQIKGSVFDCENPREKYKITSQIKDNNLPDSTSATVGNDFDKYLKHTGDSDAVAYIGNSRVPIYKDPSQLVVNTQQDNPLIPSLTESYLSILNTNKSESTSSKINFLLLQKEALKAKLAKYPSGYYPSELEKLASIEGKIEWLEKVERMSPETLIAQEKNWGKIAEMAGLAEYSYKEKEGLPSDSSWKPVENNKFANTIANANKNDVGFHCELVEKDDKYVLSFRGTELTDIIKDGATDVTGDIYKSAQTQIAIRVTKNLIAAGIDPKDIQLTGHSLGGRLAAESAIECGLVAYTFNAADISHGTKSEIGINNKGNIINIVSANDPLTTSSVGLGSSKGNTNAGTVRNITAQQDGQKDHIKIEKSEYMAGYTNVIKEAETGHGIASLRQALEQRHKDIEDALEH